jgi:hypothetical protein
MYRGVLRLIDTIRISLFPSTESSDDETKSAANQLNQRKTDTMEKNDAVKVADSTVDTKGKVEVRQNTVELNEDEDPKMEE